jgi:hypothetical protein
VDAILNIDITIGAITAVHILILQIPLYLRRDRTINESSLVVPEPIHRLALVYHPKTASYSWQDDRTWKNGSTPRATRDETDQKAPGSGRASSYVVVGQH